MSDMDLVSTAGNIAARGTVGTIQAETGEGSIEISFADTAPAGSRQRLATRTGSIVVGVTDQLDARVRMATSAMFSSDYSIQVERHDGEEPNKTAHAVIGTPNADVLLESRRGEIRLQRRVVYRPTPEEPSPQTSESESTP
ncbi:DUF4097 family beta strand repeat-containing protein [Marilutibacter alkalisoli]|uniref:hypothetical protein n=1 Tax=Marilutibacter alkalisoli TaxID=2591633 RepID=UPI001424628B|nr:hypothetical protein [Lysobacter alkalisoli]